MKCPLKSKRLTRIVLDSQTSNVLSYIESIDVILGNEYGEQQVESEIVIDLESRGLHRSTNQIGKGFRSLVKTSSCENSGYTVWTCRIVFFEITTQMFTILEEMRSDLNSHMPNTINSAITERVLPIIRNALMTQNSDSNAKVNLQSDGLKRNPDVEPNSLTCVQNNATQITY